MGRGLGNDDCWETRCRDPFLWRPASQCQAAENCGGCRAHWENPINHSTPTKCLQGRLDDGGDGLFSCQQGDAKPILHRSSPEADEIFSSLRWSCSRSPAGGMGWTVWHFAFEAQQLQACIRVKPMDRCSSCTGRWCLRRSLDVPEVDSWSVTLVLHLFAVFLLVLAGLALAVDKIDWQPDQDQHTCFASSVGRSVKMCPDIVKRTVGDDG